MCTVCSKLISALHLWLLTCICVFGGASIVAVVINRLLISLETLAIRRAVHSIQWVQSVRIHTLLCFSFSYLLFDAKNAKAKKKNHRSRNCYNECSIVWKAFGYKIVGLNCSHTSHLCRLVSRRGTFPVVPNSTKSISHLPLPIHPDKKEGRAHRREWIP